MPGQTISVEDAIRALVTKSANDVAVVVAEAIGGDEETFARMMTRKARALGMSRTVYANASGLPDEDQLTTARDQVTLGRAIQDRFPRYYRYFATPSFVYRGHAMRNHNKLLGRVEGVDGIKTGYTRASGFNLVSSVRRGNRHIVAVVLGGASGAARDARMRALIEQHIASASTNRTRRQDRRERPTCPRSPQSEARGPATSPSCGSSRADVMAPVAVASMPVEKAETPAPRPVQSALRRPHFARRAPKPGSGEPINPVKVKTITVKAGNVQTATLLPLVAPRAAGDRRAAAFRQERAGGSAAPPPPGARPGILGTLPVEAVQAPQPQRPAIYQTASAASVPVTTGSVGAARRIRAAPGSSRSAPFPKETEAQERLREAQSLGKRVLAKAEPFTERFVKGSQEFYRARFAGFDQDSAEAACKYFKRNDIACLAIRN